MSLQDWWAEGAQVNLSLQGAERAIFVRSMGSGPSMTLLHGFPSSSHDWAKVAGPLAERYRLTMPDLLGFGASDKPGDHDYSFMEQADLVEGVWAAHGIDSTFIVAHDYSVTVTQELLARRADDALAVDITSVHLLNGGLYPDLHRPQPIQHALLDPDQGPKISAGMSEELLTAALLPTFGDGFDARADCADIWTALNRGNGQANAHLLIRYIDDRFRNAARWVGALESTDVPLAFVWGMLDPISGAHIAERIRERLPAASFTALEDVAHWPPLEAPERVVAALLGRR